MNETPKLKDKERTVCEVWTRVMGYYRPTRNFNVGKQSEYEERICFKEVAEETSEKTPE